MKNSIDLPTIDNLDEYEAKIVAGLRKLGSMTLYSKTYPRGFFLNIFSKMRPGVQVAIEAIISCDNFQPLTDARVNNHLKEVLSKVAQDFLLIVKEHQIAYVLNEQVSYDCICRMKGITTRVMGLSQKLYHELNGVDLFYYLRMQGTLNKNSPQQAVLKTNQNAEA